MYRIVRTLGVYWEKFKSKRFRNLVTFKKDSSEGLMPDIEIKICEFEHLIIWKTEDNLKIPEPWTGIDKQYDMIWIEIE